MRTTLTIHDGLYSDIKEIAKESGRTISSIVHDFLLESLTRYRDRRDDKDREHVELPVFQGALGTQPGVDLSDNADLLRIMEDDGDGPA